MKQAYNLKLLGVTVQVKPENTKGGLQWQYRFNYPARRGGKSYKGTLGSVNLLTKAMIQEVLLKKVQGIQVGPKPIKKHISEFVKIYMERHGENLASKGRREKIALDQFLKYAGDCLLDQITIGTVEDFIRERLKTVKAVNPKTKEQKTITPATINRDITALKSAFNKAIK